MNGRYVESRPTWTENSENRSPGNGPFVAPMLCKTVLMRPRLWRTMYQLRVRSR